MRSNKPNCSLAVEFALIKENIWIQNENITQVFVIQSEQDPLEWFGVLFVDAGLYMGATVRFKILIDETYPNCGCPTVLFDPIPFHPLIEPETGKLDTKNAFSDWTSSEHKLYHLLSFIKRVIRDASLYIEQISSSIRQRQSELRDNVDTLGTSSCSHNYQNDVNWDQNIASLNDLLTWPRHTLHFLKVYESDQDEFRLRVEDFKAECYQKLNGSSTLIGSDKNALVFSDWIPEVHEPVRECILAGRFNPPCLLAAYHKGSESVSFIAGNDD